MPVPMRSSLEVTDESKSQNPTLADLISIFNRNTTVTAETLTFQALQETLYALYTTREVDNLLKDSLGCARALLKEMQVVAATPAERTAVVLAQRVHDKFVILQEAKVVFSGETYPDDTTDLVQSFLDDALTSLDSEVSSQGMQMTESDR